MHQPLDRNAADTPYAFVRLALSLLASTIGGIGMWSVVVVLPAVQAEFGVARGEASLPYTLTMLGFGFGGFAMGTLADRYGVAVTSAIGAVALGLGYVGAAYAGSIWQFALIQGVLIGFLGASATFAPLVADVSHWFVRRRGIAVAICASGNYLSGTLWPPVLQHFVESAGWRPTHVGIGLFCVATLLPLSLAFRRQPAEKHAPEPPSAPAAARPVSPALVQGLLIVAGFACCVAMSMPQVHIVAYCGDLGYGVARGTEMLSIMLGLGIVSRVGSGFLADRIGGLATVLVGSGSPGAVARALSLLRRARLALRDLGDLRPRPGRHHPELRDRHPRGTFRPARLARGSASSSWRRSSAWPSAAGSRARSSTSPAPTGPRSCTASPGTWRTSRSSGGCCGGAARASAGSRPGR